MTQKKIQFKINGKILSLDVYDVHEGGKYSTPTLADLEEILNLVKDLQEKLANREIQALQDSKSKLKIVSIGILEFHNGIRIEAQGNYLILTKVDGTRRKLC